MAVWPIGENTWTPGPDSSKSEWEAISAFTPAARPERVFDQEGDEVLQAWINRRNMSEVVAEPGDRLAYNSDIARRALIARLKVSPDWYYAYHTIGRTDEVEVAKRVTAPTLVICGNRDRFWEDNRTTGADLFTDGYFAPMPGAASMSPMSTRRSSCASSTSSSAAATNLTLLTLNARSYSLLRSPDRPGADPERGLPVDRSPFG